MAEKEVKLMKGNEVIAHAAVRCGCDGYFGYPITPQSEVMETLMELKPWESTGMVVLQAESEVSSINMVYGGAATGKKVMTSSSSPGVSLMSEGLSYLAACELPCLVVNCQRGGPGLGTIQPSQGDYFQACKGGGHGDFHLLVLAPASVQEMYDFVGLGFDLAFKYRIPALLLADGAIGQMMEKVVFSPQQPRRSDEQIAEECGSWAACGKGSRKERNIATSLFLQPDELEKYNFSRYERYRQIEETEAMWEEYRMEDAEICVAAFGIAARVSKNAVDEARKQGIKVGLIRPITVWPFPKAAFAKAADQVKAFISVELSMGQMIEDVKLATSCKKPVYLCNRAGGMIPAPEQVLASIKEAAEIGGAN